MAYNRIPAHTLNAEHVSYIVRVVFPGELGEDDGLVQGQLTSVLHRRRMTSVVVDFGGNAEVEILLGGNAQVFLWSADGDD